MGSFYMRVAAIMVRGFIPINPFYTNFLVESKAFTNTEVSNQIAPWYFYSSMIVMFVCKSVLHAIGEDISMVCVSGLYFLNLLLLLNLRKRGFGLVRLIYAISGFITMYDVILRLYVAESSTRNAQSDVKSSYLGLLRAISGSIGCWVGQDIVLKTGSYEINIVISAATQFLGFLISLYSAFHSKKETRYADINMMKAVLSMDSVMTCAFMAGSLCDCFNIFTKLFVHNILRDQIIDSSQDHALANKPSSADSSQSSVLPSHSNAGHDRDESNHTNATRIALVLQSKDLIIRRAWSMLLPVFYFPVHWLSNILIFIVCTILPAYKTKGAEQDAKKYLKSGNLDALINIICYYSTYLITQYTPAGYKENLYITFLLISSLSLISMTMLRSKAALYLMYLSTSTFSKCAHSFTKVFLKTRELENNLFVACYISETALHVGINQACKLLKVSSLYKARLYGCFGLLVFGMIMCIRLM